MTRVLVAGVGNMLRRDDGFGPAVAASLADLPPGIAVVETGIGGVALLQELLTGYDGLILIDAVDRGAAPGTIFVLEPEVEQEPEHVADIHLVNPQRVLAMAKGMGVLPERVVIVGCQPTDTDELDETLSPPVARAVAVAAEKVDQMARLWLAEAVA